MLDKEIIKYLIGMLKEHENKEEDIFSKIFEIRLNFINENINKNKEYLKTTKQIYKLYDEIENNINDDKIMNLIDDWMCLENVSFELKNEEYYKTGMRDGINLILVVLDDLYEEVV